MLQVQANVLETTSKNNVAISILQGYVTDVYPATMSVDVTIPSASMILYGVALSMPAMSKESRSITMPKIGSPITVCTTSTGGSPVALGAYYTPSAETTNANGMNEIIYPGEHLQTGGLSHIKQTRDGNMILGSRIASGTTFFNSGKTYTSSLEKHEATINLDVHDGFSIEDITSATGRLYTNSKKIYYQERIKPCNVYTAATASSHKTEILQDTQEIFDIIDGTATSPGYIKNVAALQDLFISYNATTAAEKIAAVETLMNTYILSSDGAQIHIDFGYVSDDSFNIPVTAAQSSEGHNVVARIQMIPKSGTTREILLDDTGILDLNLSKAKINGNTILSAGKGTNITSTSGNITVQMNGNMKTITPSGACTFTPAAGGYTGQHVTFIITTSGTTSYTLTWGSGFITTGVLTTGVASGKTYSVDFVYNGTNWIEVSRTTAM